MKIKDQAFSAVRVFLRTGLKLSSFSVFIIMGLLELVYLILVAPFLRREEIQKTSRNRLTAAIRATDGLIKAGGVKDHAEALKSFYRNKGVLNPSDGKKLAEKGHPVAKKL